MGKIVFQASTKGYCVYTPGCIEKRRGNQRVQTIKTKISNNKQGAGIQCFSLRGERESLGGRWGAPILSEGYLVVAPLTEASKEDPQRTRPQHKHIAQAPSHPIYHLSGSLAVWFADGRLVGRFVGWSLCLVSCLTCFLGFLAFWASGFLGWASGFLDAWVSECLAFWVPGFLDSWVSGFLCVWVFDLMGLWVSGFLGFWISGFLAFWLFWMFGFLSIWVSEFQGFWVSGLLSFLGFWVSGFLGFWISGFLDF